MIKSIKRVLAALTIAAILPVFPQIPTNAASTKCAEWNQNSGTITAISPTLTGDNYLRIGGESAPSDIDFDVLNNIKFDNEGRNYRLEVSYIDSEDGFFYFEYTDVDGNTVKSDIVHTKNSNNLVTSELNLERAYFNRDASIDFRICSAYNNGYGSTVKSKELKIKNIAVYDEGTYGDANVDISTDKAGNIFYTGEVIDFKAEIKNYMDKAQNINVQTDIYLLGENDEKIRVGGDTETVTVAANTTALKYYDYTSKASKYGRYLFSITLSGGERGIYVTKEYEFSKCVYNDTQNLKFGVNSHTSRGRGDADTVFSLAQNAGIGSVRETVNWESYEPTQGNYALTETQKYSLESMKKHNLDPLITIYGNNRAYESGDYVTSSNTENYKTYITKLLGEPEMAAVKKVEIYNEPDMPNKRKYGDTIIEDSDGKSANEKRGEYYGDMLTAGYDAVKAKDSSIQVYGLSFCRLANVNWTTNFLNGVATKVNAYSTSHNGKLPFDKVSVHPYVTSSVESDTGSDIINGKNYWEIVDYYKSVFDKRTSSDSSFAVTEYGFTNTDENDILCGRNEHTQAVLNLRAYLIMQSNNFDNTAYVYDFMDDGIVKNAQEHNYGMIKNEDYRVPYAAKANYLAVSALNLFTDGATSTGFTKQNDGYVAEFTKANGKTYALWNTASGTMSYNLPTDAVFYDMYGNEIAKSEIYTNGKYKVSEVPYYAVTGGVKPVEYDRVSGYVKISGEVASNQGEVDVSLTIVPAEDKTNAPSMTSAVYINQMKTYQNGEFEFRVAGLEDGKEYRAYIKAGDNSEMIIKSFTTAEYIDYIKLYSDGVVVRRLNTIDMKNSYMEIDKGVAGENYKAICACYKDGVLVYMAMSDISNTTDTDNGTLRVDVSTTETLNYNEVKLFLWNSDFSSMKPICEAKVFNK